MESIKYSILTTFQQIVKKGLIIANVLLAEHLEKQRVFSVSSAFKRTLGYSVSNM